MKKFAATELKGSVPVATCVKEKGLGLSEERVVVGKPDATKKNLRVFPRIKQNSPASTVGKEGRREFLTG
jgi:hypothetical protein